MKSEKNLRDNLGLTRMGEDDTCGGDGNDILFGLRSINQVLGNEGGYYLSIWRCRN